MSTEAFAEDCRLAAVVVSRLDAPAGCDESALVIDRAMLARRGPHAFYSLGKEKGATFMVTIAYPEIQRPWMPAFNNGE